MTCSRCKRLKSLADLGLLLVKRRKAYQTTRNVSILGELQQLERRYVQQHKILFGSGDLFPPPTESAYSEDHAARIRERHARDQEKWRKELDSED